MTADGQPVSGSAAQPRRLALLALLAGARDRALTRDKVIASLWPDADEERARRALTQALYALRQDLGSEEVFLGVKDLRLNPDIITADVTEYRRALETDALDRAVQLYRGPFLDGFHLPGAEDFERWVEEERTALAHDHVRLLERLAARASGVGDHRAAGGWFRKLAALDPLNAKVALGLMRSLVAQGDSAAALQHARVYEALLQQELDLPPDREVVEFAEAIKSGKAGKPAATPAMPAIESRSASRDAVPAEPPPSPTPAPLSAANPHRPALGFDAVTPISTHTSGWAVVRPATLDPPSAAVGSGVISGNASLDAEGRGRIKRRATSMVAAAAIVLGFTAWYARSRSTFTAASLDVSAISSGRLVAVGRVADYSESAGAHLGLPLADMLATNLARASGVQVVSSVRMLELVRQLAGGGDTSAVVVTAAREAGARELVDGALYQPVAGRYRLDLRRVDLGTGAVLQAYTVEGPDLFTLADSGTARLVNDLGGTAPQRSLADVSTKSVAAYRSYEEGLRAYFAGDRQGAEELFAKALKADSTFAMAQFYYAKSTVNSTRDELFRRLKRAMVLSAGATDRERLLIAGTWAFANSSPSLRSIADTLMVRYPAELEGYLYAGQGALLNLDWTGSRQPLHEVISRDSLGLRGTAVRCLACEALATLAASYSLADSLPGALKIARLWTRLQPTSGEAWRFYTVMLAQSGRIDSAIAALHTADSVAPDPAASLDYLVAIRLYASEFAEAEQLLRAKLQTGKAEARRAALWDLSNTLRQRGQFREALELARQYRTAVAEPTVKGSAPPSAFLEAQVLFDQGQFRASAALFDSVSRSVTAAEDSSSFARNRVWSWVHMADGLAAAGDTAPLSKLADTVRTLGRLSGYARDQRLHYHIRGQLQVARGALALAAVSFQQAMSSPNNGFSRTNYELANIFLRLKRPREAIGPLQSALRGSFEGGNLYITRADIHERLALAWQAAGNADSAAVHFHWLMSAWEHADSAVVPRRLAAEAALAQLARR